MKITDVRALYLSAPLKKPLGGSARRANWHARQTLLIEVHTDEGIVGWGESFAIPDIGSAISARIFKPLLLGENPLEVERLWDKLYFEGCGYHGRGGLMVEVLSGIDIALWDIKGKTEGKPLYQLLDPQIKSPESRIESHETRNTKHEIKLKCYATGLYFDPLEEILKEAAGYVEQGFDEMKMKVGLGIDEDAKRVAAVRKAIGSDVKLSIDANCGYTAEQAIALGLKIADCGILWFEEPVIVEDWDGYRKVREALKGKMLIAGGEGEYLRWGFKELLSRGCVDIVQPDVMRAGGITECLRIARLSQQYNVPYAPHVWCSVVGVSASLHLAAVLENFEIFELDRGENPLRDQLAAEPLELKDCHLTVPQKPGLGIELDKDALARWTVMTA